MSAEDLECFTYRQVLHQPLIVDWEKTQRGIVNEKRSNTAVYLTNKVTLTDATKLGRREARCYPLVLTG